jgi:hypothetical protein
LNIVSYLFKDADSGVNYMYHEFGTTPARLKAVAVGRDPLSHESKLVAARLEITNSFNNPTSSFPICEGNGINTAVFYPDIEVVYPDTLRVTLEGITLHDNIWFKIVTGGRGITIWAPIDKLPITLPIPPYITNQS